MKKGNVAILFLIVLALVLGVAAIFGYQRLTQKTHSQPSTLTSSSPVPVDETANWKTYTNKTYSYSIKYPENWETYTYTSNNTPMYETKDEASLRYFREIEKNVDQIEIDREYGQPGFLPSKVQLIDSWSWSNKEVNNIQIDGVEAVKISGYLDGKKAVVALFYSRNNYFEIHTLDFTDETATILNQMLPTFKFLNDETANWKTYTNTKYGFTIKHPQNLIPKENQNGEIQLVVNFSSPKNEFAIDIQKEDAIPNWPGNSGYKELKTINGIEWKVFPSSKYCDAGKCSDTSVLYRISHNTKSFHIILTNMDEKTIDQILSTFRFLD